MNDLRAKLAKKAYFRTNFTSLLTKKQDLRWKNNFSSGSRFDDCIQAPFAKISQNWYDEYGAVPTVIGFGEMEYMLKKPVPKLKAMKLIV